MTLTSELMAAMNTAFGAVGLCCLVLGLRAIRGGNRIRHRKWMLAAVSAHALFLAGFVARFVMFGFSDYHGPTSLLWLYRVVFFTHEPISVMVIPLVLVTLAYALAGRFDAHRDFAPVTAVLWLYSAVTGLGLWVLLYSWG